MTGFAGLKFHELRHTCATLMLDAGESMEAVSAMLGHANSVITSRIYAHRVKRDNSARRARFSAYRAAAGEPALPPVTPIRSAR